MIVIVDYGVGNIASLVNMLDHLGFEAAPSSDPARIAQAAKLILPGIGAFDHAVQALHQRGLIAPLAFAAGERRAELLGVCLGMQLLARGSEEGTLPGLGLIAGDVVRLAPPPASGLKVPNTGWRDVVVERASPLFPEPAAERFYCVHSYHLRCDDPADAVAAIDYGGPVTVAVSRGNVHGVQFHPEKSHRFGMRLLRTFAEL
jgi:glutamine amidotransferase